MFIWCYRKTNCVFKTTAFQYMRKPPSFKWLNSAQLKILQQRFQKNQFIISPEKEDLAERLNIHPLKIQYWFQRERDRRKHKNESEVKHKDFLIEIISGILLLWACLGHI